MENNVRFSVIAVQNESWDTLLNRWLYIEQTGYDTLWVADHFTVPYKSYYNMPWFEAWTAISAIAALTSRIRIGTLVTAIPWRNPAWLARQALTLDHISHGRLELGIGTGSHGDIAHSMTGVEDWKPSERVRRFKEYIEILDLMLCKPISSYEGKYYRILEAHMQPQPVQKPRPPITIGAYRPLMLRHAARYADAWNSIGGLSKSDLDEVRHQNKLLDKYCAEIGRDPETLRRSYVLCEFSALRNLGSMQIYESTDAFIEGVDKCFSVGITEFIISYPFVDKQVPVFKRISEEIIPKLKEKYSK